MDDAAGVVIPERLRELEPTVRIGILAVPELLNHLLPRQDSLGHQTDKDSPPAPMWGLWQVVVVYGRPRPLREPALADLRNEDEPVPSLKVQTPVIGVIDLLLNDEHRLKLCEPVDEHTGVDDLALATFEVPETGMV